MLFKKYDEASRKTLVKTKPLLIKPEQGYSRPNEGRAWFATTTTVWRVDELIRRSVRDWRRLLGETGHTGERTGTMRADHESVYTGTHSVFPAPLIEWILLRYAGEPGGTILDAFAGGPPRGVVATLMGYRYYGVDIRQEQINENVAVLRELGLTGCKYVLGDARNLEGVAVKGGFDMAFTCPPYFNLEHYSDLPEDLSNLKSYADFNAAMAQCALAHRKVLKPGAFMCIVTGLFRNKTGELVNFPGDTVDNFRKAGFKFWQEIILSKNFASAAKRSTTSWRNFKLVPTHEFLLVFRTPGGERNENQHKRQKPFLGKGAD